LALQDIWTYVTVLETLFGSAAITWPLEIRR
jgi:hypothetical protein